MKIKKINLEKRKETINLKKKFLITSMIKIKFENLFDRVIDHRGISPQKIKKNNSAIPLITTKIIKNGRINDFEEYISYSNYIDRSKRGFIKYGDILLTVEAPLGEVAFFDINEKVAIGQRMIALNSKNNNNKYLKYILSERYFQNVLKSKATGSTVLGVSYKNLKNIEIIIHKDIKQQEKIASALSLQERQIEIIETLIEKLEKRNQYYAEKLLSGEKRIRKNEQGEIEFYDNTEWQDVFLNGISKKIPIDSFLITMREKYPDVFKKGSSGMKNYLEIGDIDLKTKNYNIDNKDKLSVVNCKVVPKGTLLISTVRPTRGCATITKSEIPVSSAFSRYFINEDSYPMHIINTIDFISYCNKNIEGGTYPTIKAKKIDNYQIIIHKNHNLITEELKKFNQEIIHVKKIKIKEEKRFQWMLDNLLSGEYQIVD